MKTTSFLALTGRLLLATIFLASAFGKITNFEGTMQFMSANGMPMAAFFCTAAIFIEAFGGLSLVLGFYARWGALALALFLLPATIIFHWGPEQKIQLLKNMAIIGGLLQIAAFGCGEISLDHKTQS